MPSCRRRQRHQRRQRREHKCRTMWRGPKAADPRSISHIPRACGFLHRRLRVLRLTGLRRRLMRQTRHHRRVRGRGPRPRRLKGEARSGAHGRRRSPQQIQLWSTIRILEGWFQGQSCWRWSIVSTLLLRQGPRRKGSRQHEPDHTWLRALWAGLMARRLTMGQ